MELREKEDDIGTEDEFLDSYVHRYVALESGVITGEFVKAGGKRKKKGNREYVKVEFQVDAFDREMCLKKMQDVKRKIIPSVINTLTTRFASYEEAIYPKMKWLDPAYWCDERDFGNEDILAIAKHFEKPLSLALFEFTRVLKEWKSFKVFVKSHYSKLPDVQSLWRSIMSHRREEFPNLCKLASLIMSISGSNSSVERTFSVVTNILSDKRLSMRHETINESLIVYGNDDLWTTEERTEIINRAVEIYLSKKKRRSRSRDPESRKKQKTDDADCAVSFSSEDGAQSSCNEVLSDEASASYDSDSSADSLNSNQMKIQLPLMTQTERSVNFRKQNFCYSVVI